MTDNPVTYSSLIKPDSSIKDAIKQLEDLKKVYQDMVTVVKDDAVKLKASLEKVNSATTEGREKTKQAVTETDKLSKANEQLRQSQSNSGIELTKLKKIQADQNKLTKLEIQLNKSKEGSYDKLSAQYSLNKIKLNKMSAAERATTKSGKELEQSTKDIYDEMKSLQEATGKHTLSVGDYKKGWKETREEMEEMPGAAGVVVGGFKSMSAAAKKLLANPVILTIVGIVAALTALFALFKQTKRGSALLAKGATVLKGVFSALIGIVDGLVDILVAIFEDPQKAMKSFWESLKKNIVNRFLGLIELGGAVGKMFKALWSRDMKGLKNAANEAGGALIEMGTGLDVEQQKAFKEALSNTTQEILTQAAAFVKLEESRSSLRRANRELEKSVADLMNKEELFRAIANDATKSFKEREDAAVAASKKTIQRSDIQKQIARANLKLINEELKLRQKSGEEVEDLLDRQLEAYKALRDEERKALMATADNQKRDSKLKQDRLEKDLDILIDGFDNQKTINERIIADETVSFKKRKKLLDETKNLFEGTFSKQIETIQKFTGIQVDATDLISETDAVALNQKIRGLGLSEIIEGRLLEIIRERRTMTQDLADAEKDLTEKKTAADQKALDNAEKLNKKVYDDALLGFDQQFDLKQSEIDLLIETEKTKTKLRLKAERDRLNEVLKINEGANKQLSAEQIQTLKNQIAAIDAEIKKPKAGTDKDLYELAGINLSDEKKEAINTSTQFAIGQVNDFLQAKINAANLAVGAADREVSASQSKLDNELAARNAGYSSDVAMARKELALSEKTQEKALKEQAKAQKAQALIQSLEQVGSLVTASAKIWGQLGFPWAIPALGVMWGSFALSKVKANKLTKKKYAKGGLEILEGGSHASGNDIPIGTTKDGKTRTAEGSEAMAIINKKNTRKYRSLLPQIVKSLNKGEFEKTFMNSYGMDGMNIAVSSGQDLKALESDVSQIRKQGERRYYTDGKGQIVEVYKNLKRVYNAN
ncbi:MAG: hypothetical protein HQ522_07840 [Bacteroidetes bacterium]|nr:hypothetical protein [Bacteroidota bacterium]